jgi:transketolase
MKQTNLEEICVNTIRFLAVDAVQKADSGHPGAPMGMAPVAFVLWDRFLKHNPLDPGWPDRDRFVLSAGHASMLLYSLLFLTGYDLTLDDIKQFRQWGSKTPGHPEYGHTPGVETTTGPLGQGFANAVGMAMAERWLAQRYNRPGQEVVNHYTYVLASDGDLQEGISSEAASLAGHLKLGRLICLYDSNDISIDGSTNLTFTEDVAQRFKAYGWQVIGPVDGNNLASVDAAILDAQSENVCPSLIVCKTVIGYGSPGKAGKSSAHGEPLGEEEVCLTKESLGWHSDEPFAVPADVLAHFRRALERGRAKQQGWLDRLEAYRKAWPDLTEQLERDLNGELPQDWDKDLEGVFSDQTKNIATREASGKVMNVIAENVPALIGGSADLAASNKTTLINKGNYGFQQYDGRNIYFGIREHAMGAIASGMALHGGAIPFTATFLVFYDYMRPSVRLAALMGIRVIYVFTHDSIGVGEDGPTHQPVEHIAGLRSVPRMVTIRPADATETAEAWKIALERKNGPTALILSRQKLPVLDRTKFALADAVKHGGYVLWESGSPANIILIATGSEVHIALEEGRRLEKNGIAVRVVSLPSWEIFEAQPQAYRDEVLPPTIEARISIEAALTMGWERYVGYKGIAIGVNRFGASAPGDAVYEKFGITVERVEQEALRLLNRVGNGDSHGSGH